MKRLIRPIIILIAVLILGITYAEVIDTPGVSLAEVGSTTAKMGEFFTVNDNVKLTNVTISDNSTVTIGYLLDSGSTVLQSGDVVSYSVDFDYNLTSGAVYAIAFDSGGDSADHGWDGYGSYPLALDVVTFTHDYVAGDSYDNAFYLIETITTDGGSATQNANNMFHFF